MADDERPAVGTVAEEAARLLDALGGWASSARAGYAAQPADGPEAPAEPVGTPDEGSTAGSTSPAGGHPTAGPAGAADDDRADEGAGSHSTGPRCASCGAENGVGQAVTCQLCPVCQGIGLLRSVRPETVDRLADLAGALAATLRDIAGQRRAAGASTTPRPPHPRSSRVQDIAVHDEDTTGRATS